MSSARYGLLALYYAGLPYVIPAHLSPRQDITNINHIVFLVKENRSFDHVFGAYPGANGTTTALLSTGQIVAMGHSSDTLPADICHAWVCTHQDINYGRMDQFDAQATCLQNGRLVCASQFMQQDIPGYFAYANAFTLGDSMFSSINATSFPNHLYTIAASSGGVIAQAYTPSGATAIGCQSIAGSTVRTMDSNGAVWFQFPCFDIATLGDLPARPALLGPPILLRTLVGTPSTPSTISTTALLGTNTTPPTQNLHRTRC
jgi:phospholipase C